MWIRLALGLGAVIAYGVLIYVADQASRSLRFTLTIAVGAAAAVATLLAAYFSAVAARASREAVRTADRSRHESRLDHQEVALRRVRNEVVRLGDAGEAVEHGRPIFLWREAQSALRAELTGAPIDLPICANLSHLSSPSLTAPEIPRALEELADALVVLHHEFDQEGP